MAIRLLVLMVTTDCNLHCSYCYACAGDKPAMMTWQVAKQAIDITKDSGLPYKIQFSGGEPLLNWELIEKAIHYTENCKVNYQLQTNATLVDISIARKLHTLGVKIGVSLDGPPVINDILRPFSNYTGSTKAVLQGIEAFSRADIKIGLTTVLSSLNAPYLSGLVTLASYLGNVGGISLDFLRPLGRASCSFVTPVSQPLVGHVITEALEHADALAHAGGTRVRFRELERVRYAVQHKISRICHCYCASGQSLAVTPEGDCYPCASLSTSEGYCLGNVLDQSFVSLLDSKLQAVSNRIPRPTRCITCADQYLCGGGCPANLLSQNASCQMAECAAKKAIIAYARKQGTNHFLNGEKDECKDAYVSI